METLETLACTKKSRFNRRGLLTRLASGLLLCSGGSTLAETLRPVRGEFAEALTRTPRQTEGPFYPDKLPLDTDNDLLVINDDLTSAVGEVTYLSGRVLDTRGEPIRNAVVEIWQVDNYGSYLHTRGANRANGERRDSHFQGFGRFLTGSTGEYVFRTIKPVTYPGRAPIFISPSRSKGRRPLPRSVIFRDTPRTRATVS